jgi:stalled ribosome rescue protein Dom34
MSAHFHYLVWVDHEVAKIVSFNAEQAKSLVVRSARGHQHLHHKANSGDSGHVGIDWGFMEAIARELKSAGAIVIAGPASAKNELAQHIHKKHAELAKRISGVETLDHPTDGELVAFGRRFFRADDRMRPQEHRTQA